MGESPGLLDTTIGVHAFLGDSQGSPLVIGILKFHTVPARAWYALVAAAILSF